MKIANYPNSPFPERPPMEVLVPFGRWAVGQVFWPSGVDRELYLNRKWIKYWSEPMASPVDRMMRSKVTKKRKGIKTGG